MQGPAGAPRESAWGGSRQSSPRRLGHNGHHRVPVHLRQCAGRATQPYQGRSIQLCQGVSIQLCQGRGGLHCQETDSSAWMLHQPSLGSQSIGGTPVLSMQFGHQLGLSEHGQLTPSRGPSLQSPMQGAHASKPSLLHRQLPAAARMPSRCTSSSLCSSGESPPPYSFGTPTSA